MIKKRVGIVVLSLAFTGSLFLGFRHILLSYTNCSHVNLSHKNKITDSSIHQAMGDIMIRTLAEGFSNGISCKDEAEQPIKSKDIRSYQERYEKQVRFLNLIEEHFQFFFNLLVNQVYVPAVESGFKTRMIMKDNGTLKKLDLEDAKVSHKLGTVIGHWVNENAKNVVDPQAIRDSLSKYVIKNFSNDL